MPYHGEPLLPKTGDRWYDPLTGFVKHWDGNFWVLSHRLPAHHKGGDRYLAIDNTNAARYGGWELVDTDSIPVRTFAIGMPEYEARLCAYLLNKNSKESAQIVSLVMQLDRLRQELKVVRAAAQPSGANPLGTDSRSSASAAAISSGSSHDGES